MPLFQKNSDNFRSEFQEAWTQAEEYLDFVRREHSYLRGKGLVFDNPRVILILGYQLNDDQLKKLRAKERMNPAICIYTYDELLAVVQRTVDMLKNLQKK